jgi:hypothetical protein
VMSFFLFLVASLLFLIVVAILFFIAFFMSRSG